MLWFVNSFKSVYVLCVLSLLSETIEGKYVQVKTRNGPIQGRLASTVEGKNDYYAFQGIPYAKPPVGDLRFQPPVPIGQWTEVLQTISDSPKCVQTNKAEIHGVEDCLYISIYTPQLPDLSKPLLPVMVYIYGGGFDTGTSEYDDAAPDYLLDKGVVFVSFNYRLGIFGFLSLGDIEMPGNNGLKDQVLALQWIKNNILFFGGNPDEITLFGQSAGSASVSYLIQSPLTKGIVKRAIMDSGTSFCLWTLSRNSVDIAKTVAKDLKIDTSSTNSIVDGLRKVNATFLQKTAKAAVNFKSVTYNPRAGFMFAPVLEPHHEGAFMTEASYKIIAEGKHHRIPTLLGFNSLEGTLSISGIFRAFLLQFDLAPSKLVPVDMKITDSRILKAVGSDIKFHYFGLIPVAFHNLEISKFISDDQFVRPIQKYAQMVAKYAPTYLYEFVYEGGLGGVVNRTAPGVSHTEELGYLFRRNIAANASDALTRERMVTMWTNFVKFGSPTPTELPVLQNVIWKPIEANSTEIDYLKIGFELEMLKNPEKNDMAFWNDIYRKYGHPPFDTY